MRAWGQAVAVVIVLAAAMPAGAAPELSLRVEHKPHLRAMLERIRATFSVLPVEVGSAPTGLRLTTSIGGPASRERLEGRLETRTKLATPQIGCWHTWSQGYFLGLELGWAVASSAPARGEGSDGGFAGLARPTASVVHLGWSG